MFLGYINSIASAFKVLYVSCHIPFTQKKNYKIPFSKEGIYIMYCDHEMSLQRLSTEAASFMDVWQCRAF